MTGLDWALRLFAAPLLISQALWVRRTAQSLPEAAGPREGISGQGPVLRLAIIGDSSAAGVGVAQQSEALSGQLLACLAPHREVHWHLDAITGATTRSTLDRLTQAQAKPLDCVVLALGVNDATRLTSPERWVAHQSALLSRIRALYAPKRILISGMPPLGAFPLLPNPLRWTLGRQAQRMEAARTKWLAGQSDCTLMPFSLPMEPALMASDGFHPSGEVYRIWAEVVASEILGRP